MRLDLYLLFKQSHTIIEKKSNLLHKQRVIIKFKLSLFVGHERLRCSRNGNSMFLSSQQDDRTVFYGRSVYMGLSALNHNGSINRVNN